MSNNGDNEHTSNNVEWIRYDKHCDGSFTIKYKLKVPVEYVNVEHINVSPSEKE